MAENKQFYSILEGRQALIKQSAANFDYGDLHKLDEDSSSQHYFGEAPLEEGELFFSDFIAMYRRMS